MGFLSKLFGFNTKPITTPPATKSAAADATGAKQEEWAGGSAVPQELAAGEALALYKSPQRPVFLDVREDSEISAFGLIPGSVHIPMSEIQGRTDELDPSRPVVVYCASGMRSMDVGFFLIEKGFKDVSNLNGGMNAWSGPVENRQ